MRVRYRSQGVGGTYRIQPSENRDVSSFLQVAWYYSGRSPDAPILEDILFDFWGTMVLIPAPPVLYGSGGWFGNVDDPVWLSMVTELITSSVSPESIRRYFYPTDDVTMLYEYNEKFMTDVVSNEFTKKKREGQRVVNPCTSSSSQYICTPLAPGGDILPLWTIGSGGSSYSYCALNVNFSCTFYGLVGLGVEFHSQLLEALQGIPVDSNLDSMYASAFEQREDATMELLTSLAEMEKTWSYIVKRLKTLADILNAVRRGDFSFLGKKAKDLDPASLWLEARYAVRPLVIDVENSMRALSEDGKLLEVLRTSSYNSFGDSYDISFGHLTSSGLYGTVDLKVDYSEYASAGLYSKLQLDMPTLKNLGLTNVTQTFWEVIPWSFVLDWFVNISGLISYLSPNPIYEPLSGWTSLRRTSLITGNFTCVFGGIETKVPISGMITSYERNKEDLPEAIVLDVNLSVPKLLDLLSFGSKR